MGRQELVKGQSIQRGIDTFKSNPAKYLALIYQTNMVTDQWPAGQCQYTLIHRKGTLNYSPKNLTKNGVQTIYLWEYERLPPFPNNILPKQHRDKYTDHFTHQGKLVHNEAGGIVPVLPGRGMGVGDQPNLKIIGDVDPSDIHQGGIGDCWLLSAISAVAEFDGAIKRLFRKTKNLHQRPLPGPNMYTITLWDLSTWKEVDIQVDERLCAATPGSGQLQLLASKPSEDGELWVCYLEKALAAHCGGWDKITGGTCTHAWSLLTGCKEQYAIRINPNTGLYACYAKFNPSTQKWAKHSKYVVILCVFVIVIIGRGRFVSSLVVQFFFKKFAPRLRRSYLARGLAQGRRRWRSNQGMHGGRIICQNVCLG